VARVSGAGSLSSGNQAASCQPRWLGIEGAAGRTCEYAEWRVRRVGLDYHVSEMLAHSLVGCLALIEQSSQVRTEFAADLLLERDGFEPSVPG